MKKESQKQIEKLFGVRYISPGSNYIEKSDPLDMYTYKLYHGKHAFTVEAGDCAFYLTGGLPKPKETTECDTAIYSHNYEDGESVKEDCLAICVRGPVQVDSEQFAVVIRGFAPANKMANIESRMILPYVNGCSTRQLFAPERPGDPTLQLLRIPPYSSEQAHHIHSTVRVVHVISGEGFSVVGMGKKSVRQKLVPGMSVILDNMAPHHFETEDSHLLVMPAHIWSAAPNGIENNHPMFNGTFMMNQGA